jgi:CubicO group peptidase (beta-lactamase class C family)
VLHSLQAVLDGPLKAQAWCGGVLAVSASAFAPILIAHGHHTYDRQRRVRTTDYFDLASLTKVVGTTTAAMLAVDRDALDLDISLGSYLPEFLAVDCADAVRRARVTPRHLLTHTSGLPAHIAFHRDPPASPRRRLLRLCGTALSADPGTVTVYSDIGMMLMGLALDRVFRRPWPRELQQAVFSPLGMRRTRFCLPAALRSRAVPTECRPESGLPWQGIVHDENARWLGGIAGHAGLFATAGDLCRFARMLLRRGQGEKVRVLSEAAITLFTRPAALVEGSSRCLGWDSPSALCSGGEHLSPASFGHTGFTGTSLWIDPQADLAVVLLTNAVHPRRECRSEHGFFDWRRRVHSAVYEVLGVSDRAHSDRTDQA